VSRCGSGAVLPLEGEHEQVLAGQTPASGGGGLLGPFAGPGFDFESISRGVPVFGRIPAHLPPVTTSARMAAAWTVPTPATADAPALRQTLAALQARIAQRTAARPYRLIAATPLPTASAGTLLMRVYVNPEGCEAVALVAPPTAHRAAEPGGEAGSLEQKASLDATSSAELRGTAPAVLVRVHDACFTSEALGSLKCDCADQLREALQRVSRSPEGGAVLYLPQEGRGIGLAAKTAAYALQAHGRDTVDANRDLGLPDDARDYGAAADMLAELGISRVALLTNNPRKARLLRAEGVDVARTVQLQPRARSGLAAGYLRAKAARMDHSISGLLGEL